MTRITIIGGGPAGYEAALVAAQHGATVTLVEQDGLGGACVLSDCVPSKTFIASSEAMTGFRGVGKLGVDVSDPASLSVNVPAVHGRVKSLAAAQSSDIRARLERSGIRVIAGNARFAAHQPGRVTYLIDAEKADGSTESLETDIVLLATGGQPKVLPGAIPDGQRILTWRQIYDLAEFPQHLIVVGSGVTGAEFASAYNEMGVRVTLISSRDRLLPGVDAEGAALLERVFEQRGMQIIKHARATSVQKGADGITVMMEDGRAFSGSHALMTVGLVPNTTNLGLENVGVEITEQGYVKVDRVSRSTAPGVYAAGDCTGVLALASVAGMQGRIAIWHALGKAVSPLKLKTVASTVFTHPEIATVGIQQDEIDAGTVPARTVTLPLATNARAKMQGLAEGFVKLFCRPVTGGIIGGVVVAPQASELILSVAMAVRYQLTVSQLANTFSVYPSLSGSLTEAGRLLVADDDLD